MLPTYFQIPFQPVAQPEAVVHAPHVRFTVLTSRLLRLEYSPIDRFEDRPSQVFWYRQHPAPKFDVERSADRLAITTEQLRLVFRFSEQGFVRQTLSIEVKATGAVWKYGDEDRWENLHGTTRTLDGVNGAAQLEPGLMSRSGWSVVEDSRNLVFNEQGWLEARPDAGIRDLYFFGYGHDYKQCLRDFCKVAGRVPLIPRYSLGNWWSRYWNYSQQELIELMTAFKEQAIPLSVCIVDMDWHVTQTGNDSSGWTGYTFNRDLFPDPTGFNAWLHQQGLRTALNLHPADGVHPHEEQYAAMARAMNIDPASEQPVDFDIADPKFMQAYFEILHHPYEKMGVDFWWLDWQQGTRSKLAELDPLLGLNHFHFYDLGRDGSKRSFIFSRWFGLGNHRYPIGFSGDTVVSWESLAFQPYFTATAANVAYGWWSHDIGGHMHGTEDNELYARWVQFGAFSPILRLHSTNNPYQDRRPWVRDETTLRVIRAALQLRHQLIPYLYTMAWRNHVEDMPLITPMYYDYPETEDAYRCPNQYTYGTELIAAPFTTPLDPDTRLSRQPIWLPPGDWFGFFTGEYYAGDRWLAAYGTLDDIPVYAKAGAIVPLATKAGWGGIDNPADLEIHVFPGADNRFELYEDDGLTNAYQHKHFGLTSFSQHWQTARTDLTIEPVRGEVSAAPASRTYTLIFHCLAQPDHIEVRVNGVTREIKSTYAAALDTFTLAEIAVKATDKVAVTLAATGTTLLARIDRRAEKCRQQLRTFRMESDSQRSIDERLPEILIDASVLQTLGAGVTDAHIAALRSVIENGA